MEKEQLMTEEQWLAKHSLNQKNQKKRNVRKGIRNGVALTLVAVLSIAGTLAYLQKKTDPKTNTFTGSTGLKLSLTESNWDKDNDGTADDGEPMKEAEAYIPGNSYKKNPQLINWDVTQNNWSNVQKESTGDVKQSGATNETNSTYTYSEYVAFEVDLLDQSGSGGQALTYDKLTNAIEDIVFDSGNWVLIAYYDTQWNSLVSSAKNYFKTDTDKGKLDTTTTTALSSATKFVFAYGTYADSAYTYTALASNAATTPLFSEIKIKQKVCDFSSTDGVEVTDPTQYPKFDIKLIGGSVDTKTYASTTDGAKNTQIGADLLTVLGAVNTTTP